jgi:hypothetical protein
VGSMVDGPPGQGVLVPDAFQVGLHRADRDVQLAGDRLVRPAAADRMQDLLLAW